MKQAQKYACPDQICQLWNLKRLDLKRDEGQPKSFPHKAFSLSLVPAQRLILPLSYLDTLASPSLSSKHGIRHMRMFKLNKCFHYLRIVISGQGGNSLQILIGL